MNGGMKTTRKRARQIHQRGKHNTRGMAITRHDNNIQSVNTWTNARATHTHTYTPCEQQQQQTTAQEQARCTLWRGSLVNDSACTEAGKAMTTTASLMATCFLEHPHLVHNTHTHRSIKNTGTYMHTERDRHPCMQRHKHKREKGQAHTQRDTTREGTVRRETHPDAGNMLCVCGGR